MRRVLIAAAFLATVGAAGANAQATATPPAGDKGTMQPGTMQTTPAQPGAMVGAKLEPGANSFTEGQVKSRLDDQGFNDVTDLKKDDQGIWRGSAMHAGKKVSVGVDYKGNISAQ